MKKLKIAFGLSIFLAGFLSVSAQEIIHDAEQTILEEQFGAEWRPKTRKSTKNLSL